MIYSDVLKVGGGGTQVHGHLNSSTYRPPATEIPTSSRSHSFAAPNQRANDIQLSTKKYPGQAVPTARAMRSEERTDFGRVAIVEQGNTLDRIAVNHGQEQDALVRA